jgi:alpha-galactosidase
MLEVGVTSGLHAHEVDLTHAEARAHFGAWAITSSPLILGLDVRNATVVASVWDIISNVEAIDVNQQYAGGSGTLLTQASTSVFFPFCGSQYPSGCSVATWQVFSKPLPSGGAAVLVLNHGAGPLDPMALPLASIPGLDSGAGSASVRDVWAHADLAPVAPGGSLPIPSIDSHDSVFYRLAPQ